MDDLISRQAAIDAIRALWDGVPTAQHVSAMFDCEDVIQALPSAQPEPEEWEWCHDCKEYDHELHCCHRWTKVIRETVEEFKQSQNIIHCKDCIHIHDNDCPISWGRQDFDYCSWAERRQK